MGLRKFLDDIFPSRLSRPSCKQVTLVCDKQTQKNLYEFALESGFDLTQTFEGATIAPEMFSFHLTIIKSVNSIQLCEGDRVLPVIETKVKWFEVLGVDRDFPVLRLNLTEPLATLRDFYEVVEQLVPQHLDFKPHITLSYNWDGKPDIDNLHLPTFPICFDRIIIGKANV